MYFFWFGNKSWKAIPRSKLGAKDKRYTSFIKFGHFARECPKKNNKWKGKVRVDVNVATGSSYDWLRFIDNKPNYCICICLKSYLHVWFLDYVALSCQYVWCMYLHEFENNLISMCNVLVFIAGCDAFGSDWGCTSDMYGGCRGGDWDWDLDYEWWCD